MDGEQLRLVKLAVAAPERFLVQIAIPTLRARAVDFDSLLAQGERVGTAKFLIAYFVGSHTLTPAEGKLLDDVGAFEPDPDFDELLKPLIPADTRKRAGDECPFVIPPDVGDEMTSHAIDAYPKTVYGLITLNADMLATKYTPCDKFLWDLPGGHAVRFRSGEHAWPDEGEPNGLMCIYSVTDDKIGWYEICEGVALRGSVESFAESPA